MTRKNPVVAAMRDLRDIYGPDVEPSNPAAPAIDGQMGLFEETA